MKTSVAAVLTIVLVGCSPKSAKLQNVEIVEFGRFETNTSTRTHAEPGAIAGRSDVVLSATLLENTTRIRAAVGTSFGMRVRFVGSPVGDVVPCVAKCIHPQMTDPVSGRSSRIEQWENFGTIGSDGYIGYTFDNDWELLPGNWTIQIFFGAKLMAEKTFSVFVTPNA